MHNAQRTDFRWLHAVNAQHHGWDDRDLSMASRAKFQRKRQAVQVSNDQSVVHIGLVKFLRASAPAIRGSDITPWQSSCGTFTYESMRQVLAIHLRLRPVLAECQRPGGRHDAQIQVQVHHNSDVQTKVTESENVRLGAEI